MVDIIPGILESEWSEIEAKIKLVAPFVPWVQIDVADGTMVPTTSVLTFDQLNQLVTLDQLSNLSFEAHLLVASPEKYIHALSDAGFKRVVAHVEAHDPRVFIDEAKFESFEVGLALDAPTNLELLEPFIEDVDYVLLMMNEAGVKDQPFQHEQIEKIVDLHKHSSDIAIEVEGGIDARTAKLAREAGATRIVSTHYIFHDLQNIQSAIQKLGNG